MPRPKGSKNKATLKRQELVLKILQGRETPLSILWKMATGKLQFDAERFEAAKAAAPYVHPKLQAITLDGNLHLTHEQALESLDDLDGAGLGMAVTTGDGDEDDEGEDDSEFFPADWPGGANP